MNLTKATTWQLIQELAKRHALLLETTALVATWTWLLIRATN